MTVCPTVYPKHRPFEQARSTTRVATITNRASSARHTQHQTRHKTQHQTQSAEKRRDICSVVFQAAYRARAARCDHLAWLCCFYLSLSRFLFALTSWSLFFKTALESTCSGALLVPSVSMADNRLFSTMEHILRQEKQKSKVVERGRAEGAPRCRMTGCGRARGVIRSEQRPAVFRGLHVRSASFWPPLADKAGASTTTRAR